MIIIIIISSSSSINANINSGVHFWHPVASLNETHVKALDSLRGSSLKLGTIQRRLAWPLRKDKTNAQ